MSQFSLTGERPELLNYGADKLRQALVKNIIQKSVWERAQKVKLMY